MIVQKELVAIYDYEVPVPEDPFSFRLEIHKCSELFTGSVYRLERFRLRPTFHQRDREDADPLINDAGNDSNLLIVFYVQIMPDDFVMQLHRF